MGCQSSSLRPTLYAELGGDAKIDLLTDHFIDEISRNKIMFSYFERSDVVRFKEKFKEHLCMLTDGPCTYTGDNMIDVHTGMDITEHDFNLGVELLINAMNRSNIGHTTQNKILAVLARQRKQIINLK